MSVEKVLRVAWWSILLGLGMELLLLLAAAGMGAVPGIKPIVADLVQKVSWSFIVCVGLAMGSGMTKNQGVMTGVAGAIAAPPWPFTRRACCTKAPWKHWRSPDRWAACPRRWC